MHTRCTDCPCYRRVIQTNMRILQVTLMMNDIELHFIVKVSTWVIVFRSNHWLLVFVALFLIQIRDNYEVLWVLCLLGGRSHRWKIHSILAVSSSTIRCLIRQSNGSWIYCAVTLGLILRLWLFTLLWLRKKHFIPMISFRTGTWCISDVLISFYHLLVWQRQSRSFILSATALVSHNPL